MGLAQSPRLVTDGLVFYYDRDNIKSYTGPAIQNLASTITFNNSTGTGISIVGGTETVNIPQLGPTSVKFNNIQNNYTSFSPNSADCCPNPFAYTGGFGAGGFAVSPSTLYTYSIVYKVNSGYTHPNYMYRYEYTANGGSYVTEAGVHSDSNRISLGGGWFWAWGTFTTQATTNWIAYTGAWYYRYSNTTDKLSIAKVLITPGNYTSLHPRHWPEVNTTRGTTQALLDLTRRNTVTATSLTYASNGAFSFDGTNGLVTASANAATLGITNDLTLSVFTRRAASPTNSLQGQAGFGSGGSISIKNSGNYFADVITANSTRYVINITTAGSMTSYENVWVNLCTTVSGNTAKTYLNGLLINTQAMDTVIKSLAAETFGLGNGYGYFRMQGDLSIASVYNRALTDGEVQQNFNALRGRYGI
jgi:hypothetical protein